MGTVHEPSKEDISISMTLGNGDDVKKFEEFSAINPSLIEDVHDITQAVRSLWERPSVIAAQFSLIPWCHAHSMLQREAGRQKIFYCDTIKGIITANST